MKSAKEMFEELGYQDKSDEYFNLIHYEKLISKDLYEKNIIEFHHGMVCLARYVGDSFTYGAYYLYLEELKAINKQIEKLGWNNE